ncbi:bifunctional uridylyltransferase/uridylyl-removing enzyme [alpha proteobacterium Q-1]|nr:bifunctional uridylyltransferase/uridylyl-removing enzyme [alpha proteobacterium Q-1]
MVTIAKKRQIIDPADYAKDLAEAALCADPKERQQQILAVSKAMWQRGFDEIKARHEQDGMSGRRVAAAFSYLADKLIIGLYDLAITRLYPRPNPTDSERMAVIATGGYGRGELAPFSDLDLLFLYPYKSTSWHEQIVEFMLYTLWDLGLKVGQAVRSPVDCVRMAREDVSVNTSLLERRMLAGDQALYEELGRLYQSSVREVRGHQFVDEKLAERDARHDRMGDSRYVVEPNLKDGKGGLRDLHTLFWITRFLYDVHLPKDLVAEGILEEDELKTFKKAESFLWTVRVSLHFLVGRAQERLTFDVQLELANRLNYRDHPGLSGVERFMKHYFLVAKQVGDLTRVVCAVLEARHQKNTLFSLANWRPRRSIRGFRVDGERLTVRNEQMFIDEPRKMVEIFAVAHETGYDIHPNALRYMGRHLGLIDRDVRHDFAANKAFMDVLTSANHPEINLRRMNEAGVFGKFVPDFGRIVAQMQYDMYHHYTVDEHSIHALGLLARIERGELKDEHPLSTDLIGKLVSRRVLYMAVFLHDIAKGRGGDHSRIGERVARKLCPRMGLTPSETDLVAWLVRWHLLMSQTAFKRDLADRKTVLDFCEAVKSPERLKLLLILTVVDIRAVGPGVWNGWKGQLLRDLYEQAEEVLVAGHAVSGRRDRVDGKKKDLAGRLADWPERDRDSHMGRLHDSYWISEDGDTHEHNARLIRKTEQAGEEVGVMVSVNAFQDMTEVSVFTRDRPGLFARLSGAFAVAGANVMDGKIHTTSDGKALDNFRIQSPDGSAYSDPRKLAELEQSIRRAVVNKLPAEEKLKRKSDGIKSRTAVFKVEPLVIVDNRASNRATVIEVNARDRVGLLYDLTRALSRMRLSIFSAHVATYGERAVDVFYVQDLEGQKIIGSQRIANIERKLMAATKGQLPLSHDVRRKGGQLAHGRS